MSRQQQIRFVGVTVKTKDCTFHIECYLMQNLPYPTVRHDLREAVRAAGYESLPSQHQLSEQAYVLLGAQHLAAFPVRLNQRLVPRNIHQKFPQLHGNG